MWQDEASHLTLDQTNSMGKRKREGGGGGGGGGEKEKRKRREKEEREASTSLYDLRRSVGRFSSSQELKIICSTKASHGYQKHEISPRIQVKSSGNQGFRV